MSIVTADDQGHLETLLRLAAAEADALKSDLEDLSRARATAVRSLEALAVEPDAAGAAGQRMEGRRRGLMMTLDVLARAEERTVRKLAGMRADITKLRALLRTGELVRVSDGITRRAS